MSAVLDQLADRWGGHSPESLGRFIQRVIRALHPPPDPEPQESDAHASRALSFAVMGDSVILTGSLPRLEGEAVMAAVDAWAERLRSAADDVPAAARRADGLVALVNLAATADSLPNRGGLPVALTVTLDQTPAGDYVWSTASGHALTESEQRFVACSGHITPVVVEGPETCTDHPPGDGQVHPRRTPAPLAAPIAGLASTLLDVQTPLAVGRTHRNATPAQRRALAARDRGCVIPGCGVPAKPARPTIARKWNAGGRTDLANLVLLLLGPSSTGGPAHVDHPARETSRGGPGHPGPRSTGLAWEQRLAMDHQPDSSPAMAAVIPVEVQGATLGRTYVTRWVRRSEVPR